MEPFLSKYKYFLICLIPNAMVLIGYYENYIKSQNGIVLFRQTGILQSSYQEMKYMVDTRNCKIPDIDPLNSDVWPYYKKTDYMPCRTVDLLTYIKEDQDAYLLTINDSMISSYAENNFVFCCYSSIDRGKGSDMDNSISIADCEPFEDYVEIFNDLVKVVCKDQYDTEVYSNVHAIIKKENEKTAEKINDTFSVLLVGIDTMSQLNFLRTMPKTAKFLEDGNWLKLRGYNKIDDNTFPNLMAILSGMNLSQIHEICDPEHEVLDNCDIIWRSFRDSGYYTAYAEDESSLNTFSFLMEGFEQPPADFYFRPYFLAVETLPVVTQYLSAYCTGPETSGERILNLIKDFMKTFKYDAKFGLFWMNTFSHNNINAASGMDDVFRNFFENLAENELFDKTVMVFFSDHGFRFGKIRYTYSGWLEERLPFIYIWIPEEFKKRFAEDYENLQRNSKQLTNPYDLYMTLQDILHRSNTSYIVKPSLACPDCRSLFQNVDESRSCDDASISQHLCTCMGHLYIDPNSKIVKKAAYFALDKLRSTINSFSDGPSKCAYYDLKLIISSGITETFHDNRNESVNYLLIVFETFPKAVFEATVSISYQNAAPLFTLQGIISRVDRYGKTSECVDNSVLRKYCHCDNFYTRFKKTVDILFNN